MKILLILLCLTIPFWALSVPFIFRTYARNSADRIINDWYDKRKGKRPPNENSINNCISVLTWSNKWITNRTEQDRQRIILLSGIRKVTQTLRS